jgi:hypothetical protein
MVDAQPLPSWNDGAAKSAILDFVAQITKEGAANFVPPAERITTFDNDGTLWCEQPLQVQFFFMFDRVKELSAKDPALVERLPYKAVLERDYNTLFGLGKQALFELAFATHAGTTDEDFDRVARGWLATAKHPQFGRLFKECAYRPQVELLDYLRGEWFQDLHRISRRHRLHARVLRGGLRRRTGAGNRIKRKDALRCEGQPGFADQAPRAQQL